MPCLLHRGESLPCSLCALESRLPDLNDSQLEAIAAYVERIPDSVPLEGPVQGECLHIAGLIRELAKKIAA